MRTSHKEEKTTAATLNSLFLKSLTHFNLFREESKVHNVQ